MIAELAVHVARHLGFDVGWHLLAAELAALDSVYFGAGVIVLAVT